MRHLIKFLILVIIAFLAMIIYGIFDFQAGFARSANELSSIALLAAKNVKYIALKEGEYFVSFVVNGKLYTCLMTEKDTAFMQILQIIKGGDAEVMNFTSAIVLGVLFVVVLFFPTKRHKKKA